MPFIDDEQQRGSLFLDDEAPSRIAPPPGVQPTPTPAIRAPTRPPALSRATFVDDEAQPGLGSVFSSRYSPVYAAGRLGQIAGQELQAGAAEFSQFLDQNARAIADRLEPLGVPRELAYGGAFNALAEAGKPGDMIEPGNLIEQVTAGVFRGITRDLPKFALASAAGGPVAGFAAISGLEARLHDATWQQAAAEAIKGGLLGGIIEALHPLSRLVRFGTLGAVTQAQQEAEGVPRAEALPHSLVMGIYGAAGPPGRMTVEQAGALAEDVITRQAAQPRPPSFRQRVRTAVTEAEQRHQAEAQRRAEPPEPQGPQQELPRGRFIDDEARWQRPRFVDDETLPQMPAPQAGGLPGAQMAPIQVPLAAGREAFRPPEFEGVPFPQLAPPRASPIERTVSQNLPSSPATGQGRIAQGRVVEMDPAELVVDEARFQSRRAFGKGGVSGQLKGISEVDPQSLGIVSAWRDPADGRTYVVDGHNRRQMVMEQRPGEPVVTQILDAETPGEARMQGALINMRAGTFDALDVATVLRESGLTVEDLAARGVPMSRGRNKDGAALSQLHPALFGMVVRGEMKLERGALIGRELPNQAEQLGLAQLLGKQEQRRQLSDAEVTELARFTKGAGVRTEEQAGLFGEEQLATSLAVERAQVQSGIRERLLRDKRLFGFVSKAERAQRLQEAEVGRVETERAGALATEAAQVGELFDRLANRQGPVADLVRDAAQRVAAGEPLQTVLADASPRVREQLRQSALPIAQRAGGAPVEAGVAPAEGETLGDLFAEESAKATRRSLITEEKGAIEPPEFLLRGARRIGEAARGVRERGRRFVEELTEEQNRILLAEAQEKLGRAGARSRMIGQQPGVPPSRPVEVPGAGETLFGRPAPPRGSLSADDPSQLAPSLRAFDVEGVMQSVASARPADIQAARRGRVPVRLTQMRADQLAAEWSARTGATPDALANLRGIGQAPNAEEMLAILAINENKLTGAIREAEKGIGNPEKALNVLRDGLVAVDVLTQRWQARAGRELLEATKQAAGGAAELGRGLNILRQVAQSPLRYRKRTLEWAVKKFGGQEKLDEIMRRILSFNEGDVIQLNRYVQDIDPANKFQKAYELYINYLLAVPPGRLVDVLSTSIFAARRPIETLAAVPVDIARSKFTGTPREVFAVQAAADFLGMYEGLPGAGRAALRALITETPTGGRARIFDTNQKFRAIAGVKGRFLRLGGTSTLLVDEFFKPLNAQGFLYSQAFKHAAREQSRRGTWDMDQLVKRAADIITNPRQIDGLLDDVAREKYYRVFQEDLGPLSTAVSGVRQWEVASGPLAGLQPFLFVMPFFRTGVNLAKIGAKDTFALPRFAGRAARGTVPKGGELSEEIARTIVGTGIAAGVMYLAAKGIITGSGPSDPDERRLLRKTTSWAPNAIRIGDQFFQYYRLDPLGMTIGLVADMHDTFGLINEQDAAQKIGSMIAHSFQKNYMNKSYMKGLADLFDATADWERYGPSFINQFMGSLLIPMSVATFARSYDRTLRRPRSLAQTLQARIAPFNLQDLPGMERIAPDLEIGTVNVGPIMDYYGEDIIRPGGFWENFTSPFQRQLIKNDPAYRALDRIYRETGWTPGPPSRELEAMGEEYELTDREYWAYERAAGREAKRQVLRVIGPKFDALPANHREKIFSKIFSRARRAVSGPYRRRAFQRLREKRYLPEEIQRKFRLQTEELHPAIQPEPFPQFPSR